MNLKSLLSRFKRLFILLREKGIKYTYNRIHFSIFYGTKNPFLIKLLYWLEPYPPYLEIEVTTRCNLRCIICEHTYWEEPNRDMSFEEFKGIIDQFPRLKWIGLTGIGESFLNKDFMKMLRYVKSKNKNIFVEFYDTFYFIDKKTAEELVNIGIDRIYVSLDAATKLTYEKIRVGSNFDRVVNNVRNLFKVKKEKGAHFPEIVFHYIVNKVNLQEMPQYLELVDNLSNEKDITVQFTRMLHEFKEVKDLFVEIPEETIQLVEEKAKKLGKKLVWSADVPNVKPSINKCTEWIMPFIFVTGHVIPCCAGNEAGHRDFQKETALGSVFEQSFKEIWHGEKYKTLRRMLFQGKVPLACKNCCLYQIKGRKS